MSRPSIRLVHLEDDPLDAELVSATLTRSLDCSIQHVSCERDYRSALDATPDVILADAHLPGFDGLEAQRMAGERCPDVPFIYVTGTLGEEHAVERLTAGATDYVLKHRIARLPAAVQRALQMAEERRRRRIAEEALRQLNVELELRVQERTRALQEAQAQAERANNAKSEFLSRMSHDLRTPLNAILGFAQLLQLEPLPPDGEESVAQIVKGGRHLLDLINEVLDIARIEAGRVSLSVEPVSVPEMLHAVSSLVRPLADSRQLTTVIDVARSSGAPYVMADSQRLKQVLVNLLSNAVKYNREGGTIRLTCAEHDGRLRVSVLDTGAGIDPGRLGNLFVPFERLGAELTAVEGTGLGLALSKHLIDAMSGRIGVESEPGRGSRFWIELPLTAAPHVVREHEVDDRPERARQTAGLVLYVEDNLDNVRLMRRLIARRPQVELVHAADGATALSMIGTRPPALVFLDLHLPDMTGHEVLRRIQADPDTRHIPVTILSADATEAQQRSLMAAGAKNYLTKPFSLTRVLAVLDAGLAPAAPSDLAPDADLSHRKVG